MIQLKDTHPKQKDYPQLLLSSMISTQRTIATIQIKDTTSKDFYNGNPILKKFTKMTITSS